MNGPRAFRNPPPAERPKTPDRSYGVPRRGGEMVDWPVVVERLTAARNYWVATVRSDGRPHTAPIWGVFVDDDLFLETSPKTLKARNIARRPQVSVHVELGDDALIVEGEASDFRPDPDLGRAIAAAFAAKYAGYEPAPDAWDSGSLYLIVPHTVLAWYAMPTATRWRFRS